MSPISVVVLSMLRTPDDSMSFCVCPLFDGIPRDWLEMLEALLSRPLAMPSRSLNGILPLKRTG